MLLLESGFNLFAQETEPPPLEADPPLLETKPPLPETEPPLLETDPTLLETELPLLETEPPLLETEPLLLETKPPLKVMIKKQHIYPMETEHPLPKSEIAALKKKVHLLCMWLSIHHDKLACRQV